MSKISIIVRNNKKAFLKLKYSLKRRELKLKLRASLTIKEKLFYSFNLQKLPKNSSPTRFFCFYSINYFNF